MRFMTGLIIGILLTIGTAYVVDAMHGTPGPEERDAQRMVNWVVVGDNLHGLSMDVQSAWAHVVGGAKELDKKLDKEKT